MTSIQEFGSFPFRKRRPTASTAPKYCRAIVSVITATLGVSARSRASKTRPCSSGMRSVSKKPGPAQIIEALPVDPVSLAAPSTTIGTLVALHRQAVRQRRGLHAGNGGDPPQQFVVHVRGRGRRVAGEARVRLEHGHAVDGIADAPRSRRRELLQEDARAAEQQHGDRDLNDDQRVLQREPPMIDRRHPLVAQCRQEVDPRGLERRRQAERHARDERQRDREGEHAVVKRSDPR